MPTNKPWSLFILFCLGIAVTQAQGQKKMFTSLPGSQTGVHFRNDIKEDANIYYFKYQHLYNGSGVAIGDINNDGLPDLYFSSTLGECKLYLNLGNFKFKDITEQAGVAGIKGQMTTGVNMFDVNNDGFLDILVCKSNPFDNSNGKKILYINNGNGTFTDRAKEYGLDDDSYSLQGYFCDYDGDGDMDLFFVNHPRDFTNITQVNAKMENGKMVRIDDTATAKVSNRLYENRNGHFVDVTKKAGLLTHNAYGFSAGIYDFNGDGWPDIYVANDFSKPDYLFINNGKGGFQEDFAGYFEHASFFSMGMDINDLNNDGLEDVFNLDMASEDPVRQKQLFVQNLNYDKFQLMKQLGLYYQYPRNCVQLNNGNGHFSDIAWYSGMAQTDWSWSPLIADYDNDGWNDVFISNGYKRDVTDWDYKEFVLDSIKNLMARGQSVNLEDWFKLIPQTRVSNYFFHNNGTLHFDNASSAWSDAAPSFSHGAAYVDLDNDGDLDLVVNNVDDEAFIMKNNTNEINGLHYLRFRFFNNKEEKHERYGATVKLSNDSGLLQVKHYDPQRGYLSTMEHVLHFGTGKLSIIPRVDIRFLSGKQIVMTNVRTDQVMDIYESDAVKPMSAEKKEAPLFTETSSGKKFSYTQVENDYIDFKREPLIPYKCSRKGPYYAKADVNGDKLEDIFIGGASGSEKKLMLQNADGSFTEKKQIAFLADKKYEDCGALFFDADGDGDMDLYVVSGGAEFEAGSPNYQDRLYINDGKGNFIRSSTALPKENYNGSCVIPLDFNGDGQMDLFVGGAVLPGKFPQHDKNMLLQNDHGVFKDVTDVYAPGLAQTGIVNAAAWGDIDGDKINELIIAGEWMPVMIFKWKDGKFLNTEEQLSVSVNDKERGISLKDLTGWWNCIKLEDVDNDGKMDIIVGNRGLNSRIFTGIDEPCTIYAKDFDNNGSYDAVLGYYIQGKCYPMYHRDQLIDQMPMFRKKYYRYRMYAGQTMDNLFSPQQKQGMDIYKANNFASGILMNEGNGKFRFKPFPEMAQLSTINDILFEDLDKDGIKDLLVCGNNNDGDVGTGNYDAMAVLMMKGNGKGDFYPVAAAKTGFNVRGEVRKIIYVEQKNNPLIIFLKNSASAQVFSTK